MELICLGTFAVFVLIIIAAAAQAGSKAATPKARRSTPSAARTKPTRSSASRRSSRRDDETDLLSAFTLQISYGGLADLNGPAKTSAECWVPPGEEAMVGKRRIPGGMLYVGSNLPAVQSLRLLEPALIDPSSAREDGQPDLSGRDMTYWPSYSTISPRTRSGYLAWLESGRSNPSAGLGLVFLFFYGLERRALHDADADPTAREELPAIRAEVERLLEIYSASGSFRNYASGFLGVLGHLSARFEEGPPPRAYQSGSEVPLEVR